MPEMHMDRAEGCTARLRRHCPLATTRSRPCAICKEPKPVRFNEACGRLPVSSGRATVCRPTCERRVTNRWFQQQVRQGWQHLLGQLASLRLAYMASGAWAISAQLKLPRCVCKRSGDYYLGADAIQLMIMTVSKGLIPCGGATRCGARARVGRRREGRCTVVLFGG
jgi:hypothetical protein